MADREEFQKKLAELLAKAAAQGNRMTQEELAAFFRDENLTEEQMELVVEFLMAQKIEVAGAYNRCIYWRSDPGGKPESDDGNE